MLINMVFSKKIPSVNDKNVNKTEEKNINKQQDETDNTYINNNIATDGEKNVNNNINDNVNNDIMVDLENKNKELEKKLIYLAAEYDNLKKRTAKEIEDTGKFAITKFVNDILKIYDILLTGIENTKQEKNDEVFFNGVKMTVNEFDKVFEKMQVKKILPNTGDIFDHNKHEAISRIQSEIDNGCIVQVIRCGYEFYGRLLRPAMVVVSSGKN